MPIYKIQGPDGSVYDIEGPAGASEKQLIAAARSYASQQAQENFRRRMAELDAAMFAQPVQPPETTFGGQLKEFGKGLLPGAAGLLEASTAGGAAVLPEETERAARGAVKSGVSPIKEAFAPERGYEESVGRKLGEAVGSTLPFFGLAALGPFGLAAGLGLGVSAGAGEARQRAEAKGITGDERAMATALGIGPGLLDVVAPELKIGKTLITRAFLKGGVEGATEASQAVAQNLIAKGIYDPSQEILVGAGEEGAYGAGAGALASMLVDLTLGRKARGKAKEPEKEPEKKPETALLGYSQEPFTPVALPDGSVAATREQYEKYMKDQGARAEDRRLTQQLVQGNLTPEQYAMARQAREAGLAETFGEAQPDLLGDILPAKAAEEPAKLETIETRDTFTRDMIAELENQQLLDLINADITPDQRKAEVDKLRFESALTETDARTDLGREILTEQRRLAILLPIVEDPSVQNFEGKFQAELRRAGITDLNLTPREENIISRAYDVRAAEPVTKEEPKGPTPTEPITKAELEPMEALIPERKEGVEPQQLGIPGVGKRIAPPAEEPAPAPEAQFTTVLTPEVMDRTGLPKQSGFYRQLVNKDISKSEDALAVADVLEKVRANPNLSSATKQGVENVALRAFGALSTQAEMFGPRGGVKEVPSGKPRKPSASRAKRPVSEADRAGVGVPSERGAGAAAPPTPPEGVGLVRPRKRAAPTAAGERPKPTALKEEISDAEMAAIEEEAAADLAGEPTVRGVERGAKAAPSKPAEKPAKPEPKAAPAKEAKAPTVTKAVKPVEEKASMADKAMTGYMMFANNNKETALRYLAGDLYYGSTKFNTATNEYDNIGFGKENANAKFTGGRYGKAWYESLSDADKKKVNEAAAEMHRWQQQDEMNRIETLNSPELELSGDAMIFAAPHPEVVDALNSGDLAGALRILSDKTDGLLSQFADRLAGVIGDTKVEIVDGLTNAAGKPVPGLFDPKTNTIKLDKASAGSPHSLLHESGHATLSHTLENKSHPVTKQLQQLFDDVKSWLDTAYGAQSLDEFASEAMSNPEFQQKLASINPQGTEITAWQRFKNIVGNMMRRLVGKPARPLTALDSATNLINLMLSPAPNTRNAGELYAASLSAPNYLSTMFDNVAKRAASLPLMNDQKINAFHEFFTGTAPNTVKAGVRMSLPLNALVDVAKKYLPSAPRLDKMVNEKSAKETRRNESIDPLIREIEKWAKTNPAKVDTLNEVALEASRVQVDPDKNRSVYEKDKEKLQDYDRLKPMFTKLGADGQAVYRQIRNIYDNLYQETRKVIDEQIDQAVAGDAERAKAKLDIRDLLVKRGGLDPYFPFTRSGDYWLSYNGTDMTGRPEVFVEAFESSRAREQAIKDLVAEGIDPGTIQKFRQIEEFNYSKAPPTSFMNSLLKVLESNKVPNTAREQIIRLYVNTLPATSFAQSFQRRKNRLGYQKDVIGVLRNKTYNLTRQLSNIEYASKFGALRNDLVAEYRESKDQDAAKPYFDELSKRIEFASSPSVPLWSKIATSIGFNMTLGFNISSAVVNLTQIPLVVMPYLGGKYGYAETTVAIGNATRAYMNSGFGREIETSIPSLDGKRKVKVNAAPSLDNYNFDDPKLPEAIRKLKTLSEVAKEQGQLNRSQMYDILDVGESDGILSKINAASGFIFHHGERMNRQIAMIAAYNLELNQMKKDGRKIDKDAEIEAAEEAIYLTELTNGGVAAAAAPRIAQSGLGKVLFMFKRYGVSMYYMLFKTAREALKNTDSKVRRAAMKQIAGIYGSAAIFAGIQGVPLFGVAAMIFNMFRDEDEDDFETSVRKYLGELPYKGLVNAATGLEIATRVGLSDLIFRDQKGPESQTVMLSLMETLGGPVYGVASRVERGLGLINEGYTARGIEQMLPSAAGNVLKAVRYGTEGAKTLRGDPITGEIGTWNVFAQGFGFAPAEYTKQLEINANTKRIDRSTNEERTKLLRQYYIASRLGDQQAVQETAKKMTDFNKRHPGAAILPSTIMDSMKQHMKTSATMYHGIVISKNMRAELMNNIAEYDNDLEEYEI